MSPIPPVATALAFSPAAPSVALNPDSAGQSAAVTSQRLLETGGFLFAVVALLSLAGYFYHGRGVANCVRSKNTWASLTSILWSIRQRGSTTASTTTVTDWTADREVGFAGHVSMVYAKYFHPTSWNLVECHPATSSAPAICVEEENWIPAPDPPPPGMSSFLDVDDDNTHGDESTKYTHKKPDCQALPPYDTSLQTNINFSNKIIGTTVRSGTFLSIPGELVDVSCEDLPSDSELDFPCSPYDGIVTTDSESDFSCSPYGGIVMMPPISSFRTRQYDVSDMSHFSQGSSHMAQEEVHDFTPTVFPRVGLLYISNFAEKDAALSGVPLDTRGAIGDKPSSSTQRHDVSDLPYLSQSLGDTIPDVGYHLIPTISPPTGLHDLSSFVETDLTLSASLYRLGYMDDEPMIDINVHHIRDGLHDNSTDVNTIAMPHNDQDLMRKLLAELRDPTMDCTPRSLSEDGDSEYYGDDESEASVPPLTPTLFGHNARRNSLESTSTPGIEPTDSDVSDEGPIYPLTPPSRRFVCPVSAPDVRRDCVWSPVVAMFNGQVITMPATSLDSPVMLSTKSYIRSHKRSRPLYGPQVPVARLPRL